MKILFLTLYDKQWADARIRVYQYLPFLEKRGISCKVIPVITKGFFNYGKPRYYLSACVSVLFKWLQVVVLSFKYDSILVNNVLLPLHLEKMIKVSKKSIVYDLCDAPYVGYDTDYLVRDPVRILLGRFGGTWLSRMLRISKHVLVGNERNRQFVMDFCQNVSVITGPIDTEKYVPREDRKPESSNVVVGWIGSPSTGPYVKLLAGAFRTLSEKYPRLTVELIGAGEVRIEGVPIVMKRWVAESEVADLQNFDIGIMPLPDNEWTRSKGGYKLIQYMACGIPCVASPVGINTEIIQDGFNGFLAKNEEEWVEKLSLLIENPELRRKMGQNGRTMAEKKYSVQANVPKFLAVFDVS